MSQLTAVARVAVVCSFACGFFACGAAPPQATFKVDFKVLDSYLPTVPVSVNGSEPFNFMLDTGTSRTMIASKIAGVLGLRPVATGLIAGLQGKAVVSLVHCSSIAVGGATVLDLNLTVVPQDTGLPSGLDGVLGEDFLERFDLLIDNRHHLIELEPGSGTLAQTLGGERLPIRIEGIADGLPTVGRVIVACRAPELSTKDMTLLLDSAANSLMLFGGPLSLGVGAVDRTYVLASSSGAFRTVTVSTKSIRQLRLGRMVLANVSAVAVPNRTGADTDGLLPTSLFTSVFVSHSQRYVILNPSEKRH